jgi:hypothetical protein
VRHSPEPGAHYWPRGLSGSWVTAVAGLAEAPYCLQAGVPHCLQAGGPYCLQAGAHA